MAYTQFTLYTSNDYGAPQLNGQTGSLITVLDAVLVNGYGNKTAAGWIKPISNSGSVALYKQPSGSMCTLLIQDNAMKLGAQAGPREAWATGWEQVTAISQPVGSGSGQFPSPSQSDSTTSGSVIIRKSSTSDSLFRQWLIYADYLTFYLFILPGDTAAVYSAFFFGDFFSFRGDDSFRCMINGRGTSGTNTVSTVIESTDVLSTGTTAQTGFFAPRNFGGRGPSIALAKGGDIGKTFNAATTVAMLGNLPCPNPVDNTYYMSPVTVQEQTLGVQRGRMRGMYHFCHPVANFGDGQSIVGGNEYYGKTFQVVKTGGNGGFWGIEISPTVEMTS